MVDETSRRDARLPRRVRSRRWLATGPVIARLITPVLGVALALPMVVAIEGKVDSLSWVVAVVIAVVTAVRTLRSESSTRVAREMVFDGFRTGVPSGDPGVDSVVQDRLLVASRGGRWSTLVGALLFVAIGCAPAVAAVRVDAWWLVGYVPLVAIAVIAPLEWRTDPARARLARLRQAPHG